MAQINYEISRAELSGLKIEVPADQKVTNVFNANVRKWDVETKDEKQVINVELFSSIKGSQLLTLELEKLTEEALRQDFSAAVINALDASRQQGVVVLKLAEGVEVECNQSSWPAAIGQVGVADPIQPHQLESGLSVRVPSLQNWS